MPITSKTLRAIRLEEIRRRALEQVTCVLIPDASQPMGFRPGPAPWEADAPQNEAMRRALRLDNLDVEVRAATRAGSTQRAIAAATKRPRRPGRARSLNDTEMKALARMVRKGASVKEVQDAFPWLHSRSTAYRLMAQVRDTTTKGRKR